MEDGKSAIRRTILYSDIFHFPLTSEELYAYLISADPISDEVFKQALESLKQELLFQNGFITLPGHQQDIQRRLSTISSVKAKRDGAAKIAATLSNIPTVRFIGISGSVAAGSAGNDDDIDLFVITQAGTLYITRLLLILILELIGRRRRRKSTSVADMICINMLIDESSLALSKERQDIYTAREIVQLYPLFERDHMYQKFLAANAWIEKYLPHWRRKHQKVLICKRDTKSTVWKIAEQIARSIQLPLIARRRTTETVTDTMLAFHPKDYRPEVLNKYEAAVQKMKAVSEE